MKNKQARIHAILTVFWVVMIAPTVFLFKDSVLYVAVISVYALVAAHWAAYEGARSGIQQATLDQIRAVTDGLADFMEVYAEDEPDPRLERSIDELRRTIEEEHK